MDLIKTNSVKRRHRSNRRHCPKHDIFLLTGSKCQFDPSDGESQNEFVPESSDEESLDEFVDEATDLIIQEEKVKLKWGSRVTNNQGEGFAFSALEDEQATSQSEESTSTLSSVTSKSPFSMINPATEEAQLDTESLASSLSSDSQGEEGAWEVEQILDHHVSYKGKKKKYQYKVRWAGYGPQDDQWIPLDYFNGLKMVEEYHHLHGLESIKRRKR
jgi:hypothetical protein